MTADLVLDRLEHDVDDEDGVDGAGPGRDVGEHPAPWDRQQAGRKVANELA